MVTELGEQPTPEIEPADPPPGGVDAVEEVQFEEQPLVPGLTHLGKHRSQDVVPDEVTQPDETDIAATREGSDDDHEEEAPA